MNLDSLYNSKLPLWALWLLVRAECFVSRIRHRVRIQARCCIAFARHARQRAFVVIDVLPVLLYLRLQERTRFAIVFLKLKNLLTKFRETELDAAVTAELLAAFNQPGVGPNEIQEIVDQYVATGRVHAPHSAKPIHL
ncbi:MAG: hypothetical protein WCO94_05835 [Verrucomicrobiota bacterium]